MEPEQIITLFEYTWFKDHILKTHKKDPILEKTQKTESKTEFSTPFSKLPIIHTRSKSDQMSTIKNFQDSVSPNSVLISPKLQTIFSGKEEKLETEAVTKKRRIRKFRKTEKVSSKSLTDLEFEELKGFMDLGFVFSEEDLKTNLVEIIPGLQKMGKKCIDTESVCNNHEIEVQRPYLSEAWVDLGKREKINDLNKWKIKDLESEIDVKQSLKWWAHSVASAVVLY